MLSKEIQDHEPQKPLSKGPHLWKTQIPSHLKIGSLTKEILLKPNVIMTLEEMPILLG